MNKLNPLIKLSVVFIASVVLTSCNTKLTPKSVEKADNESSHIIGGQTVDAKTQSEDGVVGLLLIGRGSMGQTTEAICTGSLISENVVLSAGHCVMSTADFKLAQIYITFTTNMKQAATEIMSKQLVHVRRADRVIQHEGFGFDSVNKFVMNDLSLIHFSDAAPSDFSLSKIPDAVEFKQLVPGVPLSMAGFGVTSYNLDPKTGKAAGAGSGVLHEIQNRSIYQVSSDGAKLIFNQSDNKGACHGDSGGPAYYTDPVSQQKYLVGITSQGYWLNKEKTGDPLCDQLNVYTNIGNYLDWITVNLKKIQ